ncbi:selenocysteine-specific translation elongation factor [Desulfurivibrio dismutans]|uniref:selenocysteine-specific translation elongation factor n=1 Tax=Desulfurivibrio dismutans TaxID=1398908 RepID=UPI0023D9A88A|nr:selenocysteine-specific translation elongation factor [Desulfurivibrio alkaliphilus]MDF1614556.1 selenocysteine-specific translation elongation factor [Desulfurivibrio alkaliphilus]
MREIVLGTAGHVDHGKTSLVKAMTGTDTDRLKEEKARGITIELGFAFLDLPCGHRLGIVDVPGHERFVRNMVAGAAGIDLVALVVAADEGIMPQTREHFEICRLLGVERGLIVITKKDMVEEEWLELVQDEVREFVQGSFLAEAPMLTVSSITGDGIAAVKETLDQLVAASDFSDAHGPFRLPVDRVFTMKGFGAVVTGTSQAGRIALGDDVLFYPRRVAGKIRGIQVHGQEQNEVEAGYRTAINVQGIDKEEIRRGDVLATPGCLEPAFVFDAEFLYLSSNEKNLKHRRRVRVHLGTAEVMGRISLLEDEELAPGGEAAVQLLLEEPVSVWPGDHYVVRGYSPVYTIGGGVIRNCAAAKRRRFKEANREIFELYRAGSQEELALFHLRESGPTGLTLQELSVRLGVFGKKTQKLLEKNISARKIIIIEPDKQRMVAGDTLAALGAKAEKLLADFHRENPLKSGLSSEELRRRLARDLSPRLFQILLTEMLKQQQVAQEESLIRLASHQVSLAGDAETLRRELGQFYRQAGLNAPTVKEALEAHNKYPASLVKELLAVMVREGELIKVSEDLYYEARALEQLKEKLLAFLKTEGEIDAPRFKNLTGLTRKFSIPLLEYFDRTKVTLRIGDTRKLR